MSTKFNDSKGRLFGAVFVAMLAAMPLIAIIAPRFLALWPGIVGLLSFVTFFLFGEQKPRIPWQLTFFIAGVLALAGLSSLWAIDGEQALTRTLKMTLILLPGLLLISVGDAVRIKSLAPYVKFLFWAIIVGALVTSFEIIMDYPIYRFVHNCDDVVGSNLNRTVIAMLALFPVAYAIAHLQDKKEMKLGVFAVFGLMLFLTHSQSAQLGAILALVCFFAFPYSHKTTWHFITILLVGALIMAPFLASWMYDAFAAQIDQMPFLGKGDGFGANRLEIWDAVGRYAMQNPLYGFGIEATRSIKDLDMQGLYRQSSTVLHPHNFALQLWIEFGFTGIALCAVGFVLLMKSFSTLNYDQARIALPVFMILLSAASFGYGMWQSWFLGLIIFTIAVSKLVIRFFEDSE